MAARINELRQKHLDAKAAFQALLEKHLQAATADGRGFTDDEKAAQATAETAVTAASELVAAEERRLALDTPKPGAPSRIEGGDPNFEKDPRKGFRSHREFLLSAMHDSGHRDRSQVQDERLRHLAQSDKEDKQAAGELAFMLPVAFTPRYLSAAGSDEAGEYGDTVGGFSVTTTRLPGILQLGFEGDPTAGRTQMVPMGSPTVEILARTDKDHTTSVSGGFTVTRKPETAAASATRGSMEMVTLKASSLFGVGYATEEILSDSPLSFVALIEAGFRDQFAAHLLAEKLRGKGGNEYLGVLTSLASATLGPTISIAKEAAQAADTIVYNNAIKMRSRCWGYGNAVWLANHDCYPQLAVLAVPVGVGGQLIYQQSAVEDRPDMLLGRPIFYTEYASKLGDQGDLILGNWSQMLEGLYQPLQSAESVHVRFLNHERTFKFWLRNAAAPWWRTPLTPNKSSDTLSPFVVLDAR